MNLISLITYLGLVGPLHVGHVLVLLMPAISSQLLVLLLELIVVRLETSLVPLQDSDDLLGLLQFLLVEVAGLSDLI